MDQRRAELADGANGGAALGAKRSFLFLQGPISSFFDQLGRALIARGHRVHRINLHFGDQLFWRLPATHYRGRFEDWRPFVAAALERHEVTDLVLHGDRRPYHIVAAEEARARGIAVTATDLGYLRPDWITLERDGMTTYSRFRRDPAAILALAAKFPEPQLQQRFHTPFWLIAALDVAYNCGLVFGRLLYPHYRYHSTVHPFTEYAGWLWSRGRRFFAARAAAAEKQRLTAAPGSYFLVPLQLTTDFQIRAHSPFGDLREAVRAIVASFVASGSLRRLVFIIHPLDNGLIGWSRFVARLARQAGVEARVRALPGGTPIELLRNAAGVVTVNSTVGVTALQHGVPVKVLGNAVFDVPGLSCQAPLAAFWHDPPRPDPTLIDAFLRALAGATQVKGGYYTRASQASAISGFVERLEAGVYPLPPLSVAELAERSPRALSRSVIIAGISSRVGLALARAQAMPGVRLGLIGGGPRVVAAAAGDCAQRGAVVDTFCITDADEATLGDWLTAFDRTAAVDQVLVHIDRDTMTGEADLDGRSDAGPLSMLAPIVAGMRRRGRGEIVLVGDLSRDGVTIGLSAALGAYDRFLGQVAAWRRQLRPHGVSVGGVVPSRLALRAAVWFGAPEIAAVEADRLAARLVYGRKDRAVVAVPGAATAALRIAMVIASRLRQSLGERLPALPAVPQPAEPAPLPGKPGLGD